MSTQKRRLSVEQRDIDLIKPYWRNPRNANDAVPMVAASIERYGFNVPLILDANGVIIAGHTRYRAARLLGLKKVPVVQVDLTEAQARELRIVDNKVSEMAQWDMGLLSAELLGMTDLANVRALFGGEAWDALLNGPVDQRLEASSEEAEAPEGITQYEVICPHCGRENIVSPPKPGAPVDSGAGE